MRVNSSSRISKRRQGSLVRRLKDIKTWQSKFVGDATSPVNKEILRKIGVAETDVANLQKKGVRA